MGSNLPERSGPPDRGLERESRTGLCGRTGSRPCYVTGWAGLGWACTGFVDGLASTGWAKQQKARDGLAKRITGYCRLGG